MKDGPNIVTIASLVGDNARATMLTSLMSGEALTATELAAEAGITKQTASSHLAKLTDARLVLVASQGRHRYYRLADPDVAELLESLMGVAERAGARRFRPGPKDPELRKFRVCYDHLAGGLAVELYDVLVKKKLLAVSGEFEDGNDLVKLTNKGRSFFTELGVLFNVQKPSRRPECRSCLDWSVRRYHLAGTLGAGILDYCYKNNIARRVGGTRIVKFTPRNELKFRKIFGLHPTLLSG